MHISQELIGVVVYTHQGRGLNIIVVLTNENYMCKEYSNIKIAWQQELPLTESDCSEWLPFTNPAMRAPGF
jgi:hypothetical protein